MSPVLSSSEVLILSTLTTAAKERRVCPSNSELAASLNVGVDTVNKAITKLKKAGMTEVINKGHTRVIKVGKWSTAPLVMPTPPVPVEGWDRNTGPDDCRRWVAMFDTRFGDEPVFASRRVKPEGRLVINAQQNRTMGGVQSYGG